MNLLFDTRWIGPTGIGRFTQQILDQLMRASEFKVIEIGDWPLNHPLTPFFLAKEILYKKPDIFFSPSFMPPIYSSVPFVFTVHDLIHLRFYSQAYIAYYNLVIKPMIRKANRVLTVSEFSRREIVKWAGVSEDQVIVVSNGVEPNFNAFVQPVDLGYPYLVYIGNRRTYKNLERLLRAFSIAKIPSEIRLALSGEPEPGLIELARMLGVEKRLVFLGFIDDLTLPKYYKGALASVYISLYEGFGLPNLEAMACGTVVVTSNQTAMAEVVGEAGVQVDPYNVELIAEGIEKAVLDTDLREKLRRKGLERAKLFSWEKTAGKVYEVLLAVYEERKK